MSKEAEKRTTITFTNEAAHLRLAALARKNKLTQGEVVEVLMDNIYDADVMIEHFAARRRQKVGARTSIRAVIERERQKKVKKQ